MQEFSGWRPQDEERDFEIYSTECRGSIFEWKDVEAQITAEARHPFVTPINKAVDELFSSGKSAYSRYLFGRQETNDCGSWGTSNGVDLTQVLQARRGIETSCYRTFKPWVYGVGKCIAGQHSDNGMSISLAMKHITQNGVLPEDLPGLPKYSGALQKQLLRSGNDFFAKWKDSAILYDIEVFRVPLDFDVWYSCAASGRYIVYGTTQRLAKSGEEWVLNGSTNHCRTCGGPVEPNARKITDVNSWADGSGFMKPSVAKSVIAKSSNYGAFCIHRIARRNDKPDYSGLGKN